MKNTSILFLLLGMTAPGLSQADTLPVKKTYPKLSNMLAKQKPIQGSTPAPSEFVLVVDGKLYPQDQFPEECKDLTKGGKCAAKPYGLFHNESKKAGDQIFARAVFSDEDGPQITEESWAKDGHVTRAVVDNRALNKVMRFEVKDGKAYYEITDKKDGTTKKSEDDAEENLAVPSTVTTYLRPHFKEILNGDTVQVKVAVLDRRESFTFNLKKIRMEKNLNGDDIMVMQMKPASIIVQALVDPMLFYIQLKTGEMFAFEGKSALKRKIVGSDGKATYKDMNVRTAYETSVDAYANQNQLAIPCDTSKQLLNKCDMKEGQSENKTSVQN